MPGRLWLCLFGQLRMFGSGRRACVTDVTHVVNVIDYVCMRTGVVSVGPDRCAVGTDRADGGAAPGRAPGDPSAPSDRGAILYLNRTGCSWRQLPHDFPPWETVYWYFKTWTDDGVTDRIHDALRAAVRDAAGRDPMASAGIVDAQSVKGADTVGAHSRGYDAGKKVNGRKRHIVVDTLGLLIVVLVTRPACRTATAGAASSTARDGDAVDRAGLGRRATRASCCLGRPVLPDRARDRAETRAAHFRGSAAPWWWTNPVLLALATTRPRLQRCPPIPSHVKWP